METAFRCLWWLCEGQAELAFGQHPPDFYRSGLLEAFSLACMQPLRWWLLLLCSLLEKHCSLSQCRCVSLLLNAFSACPFALKVNSFPLLRHQMTSVDPVLSLLLTLYLLQSPCPVNHLLLLSLCFFFPSELFVIKVVLYVWNSLLILFLRIPYSFLLCSSKLGSQAQN